MNSLFAIITVAQNKGYKTCTINGDLGSIAPYVKKMFVQYRDAQNFGHQLLDSSEVKDGKYAFTLKFYEPAGAFFLPRWDKPAMVRDNISIPPDEERVFEYFLDAGKISIKTTGFPFSHSVASGSTADKQYKELNRLLAHIDAELQIYQDSLSKAGKNVSEELINVWQQKWNSAAQKKFDVYLKFLNNKKSHINAHIIRYALNFSKKAPVERVKSFYEKINKETKKESYCKMLKDFADFVPGIDAPTFARTNAEGKMISLGNYNGKYVLLDFWGSWCKPCRERHPELIEIYNRYKEKNFEIIGVAKDGDQGQGVTREAAVQKWIDAIKADGLPWVNVLYKADDASQQPLDEAYRVISYPSNYLVDPQGKIIAINLSEKELESKLAEILK